MTTSIKIKNELLTFLFSLFKKMNFESLNLNLNTTSHVTPSSSLG